jgi:hypothetical protein
VTKRLLLLVGGAAAFWLLAGLPARWLGGGVAALVFSGAAVLLCLPPMAATLVWAHWARRRTPHDQLLMLLGGTGLRMAFVLVGGMVLYFAVPYFKDEIAFWLWVLAAYLCTLALDVALTLAGPPQAAPAVPERGGVSHGA